MNKLNNKKGISLIVLVITIIVMIILAAAIILSLQSSGIIGRANEAKTKSDVANAKQVVTMAQAEWQLDEGKIRTENPSIQSFKDYANKKLTEAGYKLSGEGSIEVKDDGTIYEFPKIPEGFVASQVTGESMVSEGLVIYETNIKVDDSNFVNAQETYNQYVWVPVEDTFERKDWKNGENFGNDFLTITASYATNVAAEQEEFSKLNESVKKYGGFYIARYEAGLPNGKTFDNVSKDGTDKPVSIKDATAWGYIKWDESLPEDSAEAYGSWENPGAARVAKAACSQKSVVSHLIYGEEWDAAVQFISEDDSTYATSAVGRGWYTESADYKPTGTDLNGGKNKLKNIYDMAGNLQEWTMEANIQSKMRYERGGYSMYNGNTQGAGYRQVCPAYIGYEEFGFRVALYLV